MSRLTSKADRLQYRMATTPPDCERANYKEADAFVVRYIDRTQRPCARGYIGSSAKAAFSYFFDTLKAREDYVAEWILKRAQILAEKARRKDLLKAQRVASLDNYPVGAILYTSWGWEQTNIDFYEVVRRVSACRVELRELQQDRKATSDMTGSCMPRKGEYVDSQGKTCLINPHGLRINRFATAWLWDGAPKNWTAYA